MGGLIFHVMNRGARRGSLFDSRPQYDHYEWLLRKAIVDHPIRVLTFCAMPNHVHFVVWPENDAQLPDFMHWLTGTHGARWRIANGTVGQGAVYQGRYKAVPVQSDHHFLRVARYVERNPVRAGLVPRAEQWRWSSYWHRHVACDGFPLAQWPVAEPPDWADQLSEAQPLHEVTAIRRCVNRGCGIGNPSWQDEIGKMLGIPGAVTKRGRPCGNRG
jgi:putative transposase